MALALHRVAPHRVAGLVLASTTAAADTAEASAERAARAQQLEQQGVASLPDEWIPRLVGPACAPDVKLELRRLMLEQHAYGVAAALRALGCRPDATALLASIRVPTALIAGEHDELTPPGVMRDLATAIRGATLTIVPGAGHMTNLEAPDYFNQALVAALGRVDA